MRTLVSGNISINVRANNLARLYYKQEFKEELDIALGRILRHSTGSNAQDGIMRLMQNGLSLEQIAEAQKMIEECKTQEELVQGLIGLGIDWGELMGALVPDKYKTRYPAFESMQLIWSMAMAERMSQKLPQIPFQPWLEENADFDVNDCADEFLKEVELGFFRYDSEKEGQKKQQHKPGRNDSVGNSGSKKNGAKS